MYIIYIIILVYFQSREDGLYLGNNKKIPVKQGKCGAGQFVLLCNFGKTFKINTELLIL